MCQAANKMEWATATMALLGPRRAGYSPVVGGEVGVFGAAGGLGGLDEGLAEPAGAVSVPDRSVLPADSWLAGPVRPRRRWAAVGAAHVGAGLGHERLGGPAGHAGMVLSSSTAVKRA